SYFGTLSVILFKILVDKRKVKIADKRKEKIADKLSEEIENLYEVLALPEEEPSLTEVEENIEKLQKDNNTRIERDIKELKEFMNELKN
ncbi:12511_t:CDS:2, partial [Racocetra fulgida]